jgi:hypothetical protein
MATIYKHEIPERLTMIPDRSTTGAQRAADSPRQVATRHTLQESFSDFRAVEGLTLPHQWRVRFVREKKGDQIGYVPAGNRDLSMIEWHCLYDVVKLNVPIDPKSFVLY